MASRYKTAKKEEPQRRCAVALLGIHLSKQGIEPAIRIILRRLGSMSCLIGMQWCPFLARSFKRETAAFACSVAAASGP
jgi:hypothetical protein